MKRVKKNPRKIKTKFGRKEKIMEEEVKNIEEKKILDRQRKTWKRKRKVKSRKIIF